VDGLEGVKGRMEWPKIKGWVLLFFRKIGGERTKRHTKMGKRCDCVPLWLLEDIYSFMDEY